MVFYFESSVVSPPVLLFMGVDKYESLYFVQNFKNLLTFLISDEDLIKWGWPEDVWFHVDKLSSAHVYLRLRAVKTPFLY